MTGRKVDLRREVLPAASPTVAKQIVAEGAVSTELGFTVIVWLGHYAQASGAHPLSPSKLTTFQVTKRVWWENVTFASITTRTVRRMASWRSPYRTGCRDTSSCTRIRPDICHTLRPTWRSEYVCPDTRLTLHPTWRRVYLPDSKTYTLLAKPFKCFKKISESAFCYHPAMFCKQGVFFVGEGPCRLFSIIIGLSRTRGFSFRQPIMNAVCDKPVYPETMPSPVSGGEVLVSITRPTASGHRRTKAHTKSSSTTTTSLTLGSWIQSCTTTTASITPSKTRPKKVDWQSDLITDDRKYNVMQLDECVICYM